MYQLTTFSIIVVAVSVLLLVGSVVGCFMRRRWAVVLAYAGMLGIDLLLFSHFSSRDWFWGAATIIVLAIVYMLPTAVTASRLGVGYIVGGVIVGAAVGLIVSHAWLIVGSVVGGILGGVAYSRTPRGSEMGFPSPRFFNYLCAKGLPAVVTVCIVGTAIELLLSYFKIAFN